MVFELISKQWITIFTIILFGIKLWSRTSFRDAETRFIWITVISSLVLVVEDILETLAAQDPSLRFFRILLSIIGYTFRSSASLGLLLVVVPPHKRKFYLWIPCLLTCAICCTAFFSPIVFGYDEKYEFMRGPLGYTVFSAPIIYLLMLIWVTARHLAERKGLERFIVPIGVVFCLSSAILDMRYGGIRLNEAIIISSVFFYIFLYSNDSRRDALTGLLNRQALYDDCKAFAKQIKGVASLDMDGLKELNDTMGHQAGDEALIKISDCLERVVNKNIQAYRTGGDEFILLFFSTGEEEMVRAQEQVKRSVAESGYHISSGYTVLGEDGNLNAAINTADKLMYEDKSNYYREARKDRRSR